MGVSILEVELWLILGIHSTLREFALYSPLHDITPFHLTCHFTAQCSTSLHFAPHHSYSLYCVQPATALHCTCRYPAFHLLQLGVTPTFFYTRERLVCVTTSMVSTYTNTCLADINKYSIYKKDPFGAKNDSSAYREYVGTSRRRARKQFFLTK